MIGWRQRRSYQFWILDFGFWILVKQRSFLPTALLLIETLLRSGILRQALASPLGEGEPLAQRVSPSRGASRVGGSADLSGLASSGVRRCRT